LSWVDEVVVFDEDTPYELIKKLNPDMIVKGGDYTVEQVVGHDIVPVKIIPIVEGYSTTSIIEKSK
jgi:D-beta-D-heptose 7-phosphate kinase/D-beta-D-heptose 1-phosphate adenosyltransferase